MFLLFLTGVLRRMYETLTFYHSITRWLVVASLVLSIAAAWNGIRLKKEFSRTDNTIRHWTATIAHIQLVLGLLLYFKSPVIKFFWNNFSGAVQSFDQLFFGLLHGLLMLGAIVVITVGSAMSKRKSTDREKFKTMLTWFSIGFMIIFIAIPWPFSPLANRPWLR